MYAMMWEDPVLLDLLLTCDNLQLLRCDAGLPPPAEQLRRVLWGLVLAVDDQGRSALHYGAANGSLLAIDHLFTLIDRTCANDSLPGLDASAFEGQAMMPVPQRLTNPAAPAPSDITASAAAYSKVVHPGSTAAQRLVHISAGVAVITSLLLQQATDSMPSAMCLAVCSGSTPLVDRLLSYGADMCPEENKATALASPDWHKLADPPIVCAASFGDTVMLSHILRWAEGEAKRGALAPSDLLAQRGRNGETALVRAAMRGNDGAFGMLCGDSPDLLSIVLAQPELPLGWSQEDQQELHRLWRGIALIQHVATGNKAHAVKLLNAGAQVRMQS